MLRPQPTQCWALTKKSTLNQEKSRQSVCLPYNHWFAEVLWKVLACWVHGVGPFVRAELLSVLFPWWAPLPSNLTPKPDFETMKEPTAIVENLHRARNIWYQFPYFALLLPSSCSFFFLSIGGKGHPVEAAHSARDVHRSQMCFAAPQLLEQFWMAGSGLKSNLFNELQALYKH